MSQDWADKIAQQLLGRGLIQTGICLILGAADTGKTTLAAALAKCAAKSQPVGIIDADIGQSHIGPPTTVGWALVKNGQFDLSRLAVGGISFVGDVTPTGHLLQLTAAIAQCVRQVRQSCGGQVSKVSKLIVIDTPGFISGPAAATLWWTVHRILQPKLVLAVQRNDELRDILAGLPCSGRLPGYGRLRPDERPDEKSLETQLELISSPSEIPLKSPQDRRNYRQSQFSRYFRDSCLYNISLSDVAIQMSPARNTGWTSRNLSRQGLVNRLVALRDGKGVDIAIGLITDWRDDRDIVVVRAPQLDIQRICCLVIGDVSIEIP